MFLRRHHLVLDCASAHLWERQLNDETIFQFDGTLEGTPELIVEIGIDEKLLSQCFFGVGRLLELLTAECHGMHEAPK